MNIINNKNRGVRMCVCIFCGYGYGYARSSWEFWVEFVTNNFFFVAFSAQKAWRFEK